MKVGDFCKTGAGGTPLKSNRKFYEGGNIPWLLSGEVGNRDIIETKKFITQEGLEGSSAKMFPINTVLIAMYGATAGEVGILRCEASTNQAVCGIYPNDKVLPEYLYYFFLNHKDLLVAQAVGNAQPNISQQKIRNTEITLPSIPEQKRIVSILDTVFADLEQTRAKTEQNLKNALELFESACSMSIFSTDAIPSCTVLDVAKNEKGAMRTGPFGSQLLKKEIVDSGIAVLGIDNAVNNHFQWGAKRFITSEKFEELSRFEVNPGDVLITIMGTCGRCAIVPENIPKAINTKHICCITLDKSKCLPEYLHAYFLYHPLAKEYLLSRAKGSIMAGLNMGIIKELPLVLPSIEEQKTLVSQITFLRENLDKLEITYKSKLNAIDELKKSILQKAFSGELTNTVE
ncbi:restriction endonuclease subunit S [Marinomonas sp. UCMA 3892]|uniref:restriction endonuclease subunit S n=1 Tax=unclassified Marinomonas TaxID=196814 RepID=UPI00146C11F9|nr:restriction endonuclease subunit S [Marinomonas sp. UCMA 3892]NLU97647.1 restriction endonuclease subunit S [Marinomonas sp. UCMA 3892]